MKYIAFPGIFDFPSMGGGECSALSHPPGSAPAVLTSSQMVSCRPSGFKSKQTRGLVSKETVVLRRWGHETQFPLWIYQLN